MAQTIGTYDTNEEANQTKLSNGLTAVVSGTPKMSIVYE